MEPSEQNRTRNMEIKNKLTVTRGEVGREVTGGKKGKGCQGTCIKDPWTKTKGWGEDRIWEVQVGRAGEGNVGKWGQL